MIIEESTEGRTILTKGYRLLWMTCLIAILAFGGWLGWYNYRLNAVPTETGFEPIKGIPVLMYHKVSPDTRTGGLGLRVPPEDFDWEMQYLKKNNYHTVSLGNVLDYFQSGKALPQKPIVITFDDGYKDNYQYAYPILKKYDYTATVFVVTSIIGKTNEFDVKKHLQPENKMMDWSEIKSLATGGITIGSHTLTHPHLTQISQTEARQEIMESKNVLEKGLGKEVQFFCYPYGDNNDTVAKMVKEIGYRAAVTTQLGINNQDNDPYLMNRIRIMGNYNHQKFIEELHKY